MLITDDRFKHGFDLKLLKNYYGTVGAFFQFQHACKMGKILHQSFERAFEDVVARDTIESHRDILG